MTGHFHLPGRNDPGLPFNLPRSISAMHFKELFDLKLFNNHSSGLSADRRTPPYGHALSMLIIPAVQGLYHDISFYHELTTEINEELMAH